MKEQKIEEKYLYKGLGFPICLIFEMKLQNFASQFGVTHAAVIKWENRRDKIAKIQPTTETCIRLFILEKLDIPNNEFRSIFRSFDLSKIAAIQKSREKETKSDFLEAVYKPRGYP